MYINIICYQISIHIASYSDNTSVYMYSAIIILKIESDE